MEKLNLICVNLSFKYYIFTVKTIEGQSFLRPLDGAVEFLSKIWEHILIVSFVVMW